MALHRPIFEHIADIFERMHRHMAVNSMVVPGMVERLDQLRDMAHEADVAFDAALAKVKAQAQTIAKNAGTDAAEQVVADAVAASDAEDVSRETPAAKDDAKSAKGKG